MTAAVYNRFDPTKEFDNHQFRAGYVLQSGELNEIQSGFAHKLKGIADALFKDGDIVRDARIVVNATTGATTCESGAIYLSGAVRGVPTGAFSVPVIGVVTVGIYIQTSVITELQDPSLLDPASETRNFMEPGAVREKKHTVWGYYGDNTSGDFYPVYVIEDGIVRSKEPPPNLDSVTQALARYDRDSAGGTYVVSGLSVKALADLATGEQVYSVEEGRAHVNGYSVELAASRRLTYPAAPDTQLVNAEPHLSSTVSSQRVNVDYSPIANISLVNITAQKTTTITHGGFLGVSDPLPDSSVLSIISVTQGGTTYVANTDYKLTGGTVDWSPAGAEPATGSTYSVTYQYITSVTPTAVDATGFTVTGAVVGTLIQVTYNQKLPRYDRLYMSADGSLNWVKGAAARWLPRPPSVPSDVLLLATVYQTWTSARTVNNDSVRVVPMSDLAQINGRIDYMLGLIARQRLEGSATLIDASQKKGLFVDPFLDDSMRDAGTSQTAAIVDGELTLPIAIDNVALMPADVAARTSLNYSHATLIQQLSRTSSMKINPYLAFDVIPANVVLMPAVDKWTDINTTWASAITQRVTYYFSKMRLYTQSSVTNVQLLSSTSRPAETLRTIDVKFTLTGFGPNETLTSVTFDGISVTPTAV